MGELLGVFVPLVEDAMSALLPVLVGGYIVVLMVRLLTGGVHRD